MATSRLSSKKRMALEASAGYAAAIAGKAKSPTSPTSSPAESALAGGPASTDVFGKPKSWSLNPHQYLENTWIGKYGDDPREVVVTYEGELQRSRNEYYPGKYIARIGEHIIDVSDTRRECGANVVKWFEGL